MTHRDGGACRCDACSCRRCGFPTRQIFCSEACQRAHDLAYAAIEASHAADLALEAEIDEALEHATAPGLLALPAA